MLIIENDQLVVKLSAQGAEMTSVVDKQTGHEYIWQADPAYWGRHAPVLFPIVGGLKGGHYHYQARAHALSRHGFARDMIFQLVSQTANSVLFELSDSATSRVNYPFAYRLQISYLLIGRQVTVTYTVHNPDTRQTLYYGIGGHPAFNVSHNAQGEFEGVSVRFEPAELMRVFPLTDEGLIKTDKASYQQVETITLQHKTFKKDALIFEVKPHTAIILSDEQSKNKIRMEHNGMDFYGIWSPYPARAPFVCLEPWAGITDDVAATGDITQKYRIQHVAPRKVKTYDYSLTFIHDGV